MLVEQPTSRMIFFPRHSLQPFHVHFDFAPKHTLLQGVGSALFTLYVANREYGPYTSGIQTTTRIWEGRKKLQLPESAQKLIEQLVQFQYQLEQGWASYPGNGEAITGEMILAKSGLKQLQGKGGLIYAIG